MQLDARIEVWRHLIMSACRHHGRRVCAVDHEYRQAHCEQDWGALHSVGSRLLGWWEQHVNLKAATYNLSVFLSEAFPA
jgi:hypothetical protein